VEKNTRRTINIKRRNTWKNKADKKKKEADKEEIIERGTQWK
jgi:hypothetical protein